MRQESGGVAHGPSTDDTIIGDNWIQGEAAQPNETNLHQQTCAATLTT